MKLLWFHLMPYPELPEDFADRARSVWVDIPSDLYDPQVMARAYADYLDQLEHADEAGFDGICVNEHHQNGYGLMPSPNLMAASLARRTSRAAIVVLGNSLVLYNPPVRVAEELAMIDCLSNGRLVAGFPVGTPMDTAFCYGQNPATLRSKYHEAHDLVLRAWTEREPFTFNGEFTKLRYVNIWPRPLQQPHPPVWIPGGGSIETWGWTADMDWHPVVINGLIQGMGMGLIFVPLSVTAFATVPPAYRPDATGLYNLFRNTGGSVGIAIAVAVFARNSQVSHSDLAAHVTPYNLPVDPTLLTAAGNAGEATMEVVNGVVTGQAAMIAYLDDFHMMMLASIAALPLLLLLRRKPVGQDAKSVAAALE